MTRHVAMWKWRVQALFLGAFPLALACGTAWYAGRAMRANSLHYCCDGLLVTGHVECAAGEYPEDCREPPLPRRLPIKIQPVSLFGYAGSPVVVKATP